MTRQLQHLFAEHTGQIAHKWRHYIPSYERAFEPFQNRVVRLLEIGVSHGGSLEIWSKYFHPQSRIIGIDIEPRCKKVEKDNITVHIGSQNDRAFLEHITPEEGWDIIIDDGSHNQSDVNASFDILWPYLNDGGLYLVEDLHTAYWSDQWAQGGFRRPSTFIERAKNLIDSMNGHHIRDRYDYPDKFTSQIRSMYVTDSIVILEKGTVEKPEAFEVGTGRVY